MRLLIRSLALFISITVFWAGSKVNGAVSLSFTNGTVTPTVATVVVGTVFSFTIDLTSSTSAAADKATAIDYYLAASAVNDFTINSRNTTTDGTPFGFTLTSDSGVVTAGANPTLNISTGINFRNGTDLGGSLTNVGDPPISNTTVVVADYSVRVAANALPGVYTLTTFSTAGTGYSDASFNDHSFSSQGAYTVTVVPAPEPSMVALVLVVVPGLALRRCRKA